MGGFIVNLGARTMDILSSLKVTLGVATAVALAGCSVPAQLTAKHIDREGVDAVIIDNAAKVTYIKENGHTEKFCAYRESDVESDSASGFVIGTGNEAVGEQSSSGALALGGRSPMVLIVREMMYRACELSINLNADQETTLGIYKLFLGYAADIARNEHDSVSGVGGLAVSGALQNVETGSRDDNAVSDSEDSDDSDDEEE